MLYRACLGAAARLKYNHVLVLWLACQRTGTFWTLSKLRRMRERPPFLPELPVLPFRCEG
jgi:hypothetical protein